MQTADTLQQKYWDFIERGDFEWDNATTEERVYFREVAAAFLRATLEPPAGYVIDVLEAEYSGSRFPIIALGWNHDQEPLALIERLNLIDSMREPLNRFVHAVDWNEIRQIKFGQRAREEQHSMEVWWSPYYKPGETP